MLISAHMHKVAQRSYVAVWAPESGPQEPVWRASARLGAPQAGVIQRAAFLKDGRLLTASRPQGDDAGVMMFWDPDVAATVDQWPRHLMALDLGRDLAVVRSYDWRVEVVTLSTGEALSAVDAAPWRRRTFDPFAAGPKATISSAVFMLEDDEGIFASLRAPDAAVAFKTDFTVAGLALSSKAPLMALAGFQGELELWDGEQGRRVRVLSNQGELDLVPEMLRVVPGGAAGHLLAPCQDGALHVWDVATGERLGWLSVPPDLHPPETARGPVNRISLAPDKRRLATAHMDQFLLVADLEAARSGGECEGEGGEGWSASYGASAPLTALGWSSSGDTVWAGTQDGDVALIAL